MDNSFEKSSFSKLECAGCVTDNGSELLIGVPSFSSSSVRYSHLRADTFEKTKHPPLPPSYVLNSNNF